eukprot:CAMPEP_0116910188 /NCGR_PEP_ID=MMETSP0467-20121206/14726_1 /TAXON_ID=283647 /ORGANISM="Mesodinium pulex, Strain SPMC105" /LENGTH=35 /DNA_ID= /DNA_START= /DNA_END= /DNA_ORIENTATION=
MSDSVLDDSQHSSYVPDIIQKEQEIEDHEIDSSVA